MSRSCFKKFFPCPEAKLIFALGILGFVSGAAAGVTIKHEDDFITYAFLDGLIGTISGVVIGKATGVFGRLTGRFFLWPDSNPILDEENRYLSLENVSNSHKIPI